MQTGSDRKDPASPPSGLVGEQVRSVAVLRLDNIGDHVLGSAIFKGLRARLPHARITALTTIKTEPLYEACPYIDARLGLPDLPVPGQPSAAVRTARARQLERLVGSFDLLINPRFARDYYDAPSIIRQLAPRRSIAFRQADPGYDDCFTDLIEPRPDIHVAGHAESMLRRIFGMSARHDPEVWSHTFDRSVVEARLHKEGWNGSRALILLAPGASHVSRRWPLWRVTALIQRLSRRHDAHMVMVGSRAEHRHSRLPRVLHAGRLIDLRGELTLSQLAVCCRLARLFVGTDSGPKHIAAATGLPVVEIHHLPATMETARRAGWPAGPLWAAYGVPSVQVQAAGEFSDAEILAGNSIAAVSEEQVLRAVSRCLAHR